MRQRRQPPKLGPQHVSSMLESLLAKKRAELPLTASESAEEPEEILPEEPVGGQASVTVDPPAVHSIRSIAYNQAELTSIAEKRAKLLDDLMDLGEVDKPAIDTLKMKLAILESQEDAATKRMLLFNSKHHIASLDGEDKVIIEIVDSTGIAAPVVGGLA